MIQIKQEELPRIFAAYPNAEIGRKGKDYIYPAMAAINFKNHLVELVYSRQNDAIGDYPISYCQLLLKNLADISDEDAIVCFNNWMKAHDYNDPNDTDEFKIYCVKCWIGDNTDNSKYRLLHSIDFLRSSTRPDGTLKPSYNCGYGIYSPQDLIDAGVVKTV